MRDGRRAPFCWQSLAACKLIRDSFSKSELTQALAIYQSLSWEANEQRDTRSGDRTPYIVLGRQDLAELSGVSARSLDRVVKRLEEIGLLYRSGGRQTGKPSVWELVEPGQRRAHTSLTPPAQESHQVRTPDAGGAHTSLTPHTAHTRGALRRKKEKNYPNSPFIGVDWQAWVAKELPDLDGATADFAASQAQMLATGGAEVTSGAVRARVERLAAGRAA